MRKASLTLLATIIGALIPNLAIGQDSRVAIQPVSLQVAGSALLAISGPAIKLQLAGATEAGEAIENQVVNSETRLRISSLVKDGESRYITAKISDALVGTQLYVELQEPNANFVYPENKGTLKGQQLLSNELESTLVEGIKTCWSGKADGDGYIIKYTFKAIPNAPILKSADITVSYTISTAPSDVSETD